MFFSINGKLPNEVSLGSLRSFREGIIGEFVLFDVSSDVLDAAKYRSNAHGSSMLCSFSLS